MVSVLACYARDQGSNPRQVTFLVIKTADIKYNFFYKFSFFIDGVVASVLAC